MNLTFKEIASRMEQGGLTPNEVAEFRNFCGTWLFRLNEQYGKLVATSARWMNQKREEYKSQAECERAWQASDEGQLELELKYRIRGVEELQSALETNWFLLNRELKETAHI